MDHLSFVKFNVFILFFTSLIVGNVFLLQAMILMMILLNTRPQDDQRMGVVLQDCLRGAK